MVNLFFLSFDPQEFASFHCDKHCVKLIMEMTQQLYTAHHVNHDNEKWQSNAPTDFWKATHINHPTTVWVRNCRANYDFTCKMLEALCKEYTKRYHRQHVCEPHSDWLRRSPPPFYSPVRMAPLKNGVAGKYSTVYASSNLPPGLSPIPLVMPPKYHHPDAREAYRNYVNGEKAYFAKWAHSATPAWFVPLPLEKTVLSAPDIRHELKSRGMKHDAKKEDNLRALKRAVASSEKVLCARIAVTEQALVAQRTPSKKKYSTPRAAASKKNATTGRSPRAAASKKNAPTGRSPRAAALKKNAPTGRAPKNASKKRNTTRAAARALKTPPRSVGTPKTPPGSVGTPKTPTGSVGTPKAPAAYKAKKNIMLGGAASAPHLPSLGRPRRSTRIRKPRAVF